MTTTEVPTTAATRTSATGTADAVTADPDRGPRTVQRTAAVRPGFVGRRLAVCGLLLGAGLNTTEAVLGQLLPDPTTVPEQIAAAAEHSTLFGTRAVLGTLAIPFMALAFVAVAQRLGLRAPRTAWAAGTLLLAGMWGFVGIHLVMLLQLPAATLADPASAAPLLEAAQSHPVLGLLFMAPFLVGCVLGMLVLTVGLLVTGAVPRWTAAAWLVFIGLDFSVGAVGPVDPHWLFLAGAVGLAWHLWRQESPSRPPATALAR